MNFDQIVLMPTVSADEKQINAMLDQVMARSDLFNLLHGNGASDQELVQLAQFPNLCKRLIQALRQPCLSLAATPSLIEVFYDDRLVVRIEQKQIVYRAPDLESCRFSLFENRMDGEMVLLMVGDSVLLDRIGSSTAMQLADLN